MDASRFHVFPAPSSIPGLEEARAAGAAAEKEFDAATASGDPVRIGMAHRGVAAALRRTIALLFTEAD